MKLKGTVILNIPDRDRNARVLISGFYMQSWQIYLILYLLGEIFLLFFLFTPSALQPPLHLFFHCSSLPLGPQTMTSCHVTRGPKVFDLHR